MVDGNMFDVSMAAKACFVDGGDCEFSLPILTNALIPKTGRQWDDAYTTKGNRNDLQVISVRNACYVNLRTYYFDSEKLLEIMDKVNTLFNLQLNSLIVKSLGMTNLLHYKCNSL